MADFTEAIRLQPLNFQAFYERGNLYRMKGELDKAIADYSEAIRLSGDFIGVFAYFRDRAVAYRAKGDVERALNDEAEAIRRGF